MPAEDEQIFVLFPFVLKYAYYFVNKMFCLSKEML